MDPEIAKLLEAGKITPSQAGALERLSPGAWCHHKSWGFGRIAERNLVLNRVVVDFTAKKGHLMQPGYAADTLTHLPEEHIHVRVRTAPDKVRAEAVASPEGLVRLLLTDLGGSATVEQIGAALAPALPEAEFRKWWTSARKRLAADGHFEIPAKKTEPVRLREAPVSRGEELLAAFAAARQTKDQAAALDAIMKDPELVRGGAAALLPRIEEIASRNLRMNPSQALEFLLVGDELRAALPEPPVAGITLADALRQFDRQLPDVIAKVPAAKVRRLIAALPDAFGEGWEDRAIALMLRSGNRLVGEIARVLQDRGQHARLRTALQRWVNERSVTSEILHWLCKNRQGEFGDLVEPTLLGAIIASLERDQMSESGRTASKLHDLVMDDRELVSDLLAGAPVEAAREQLRRLISTPAFDELDKRSLIARFVKQHPELQAMISGDEGGEAEQGALVVSWQSLERRKTEYEELVNKRIPQNSQEIAVARSYGDLRENFEYKAAKDMQIVLMKRKGELESELSRARGTAFENPDTTQVSIGTVVAVRDTATGEETIYTVLGAWDSAPERNVISYLTVIGQALLGKKPGEPADLTTEHGPRHVEIGAIRPFEPGRDFELV
jgi:transcription elongation GreA/GreB family factor